MESRSRFLRMRLELGCHDEQSVGKSEPSAINRTGGGEGEVRSCSPVLCGQLRVLREQLGIFCRLQPLSARDAINCRTPKDVG